MKRIFLLIIFIGFTLNCRAVTNAITIPLVNTNVVLELGRRMPSFSGTNYWVDMGISSNNNLITQFTIQGTNDVNLFGPTNIRVWRQVTVSIKASGGNRLVTFPTNWGPDINTNRLTIIGNRYTFTLTNGNRSVFSVRTNDLYQDVIWDTFGQ